MKYLLIFLVFLSCNNNKPEPEPAYIHKPTDTVFTAVHVALDIMKSEYESFTAMKIFFDASRISLKDSSRVEWFRDSTYEIYYKIKSDTAVRMVWQKVDRNLVVDDFNQHWPLAIKKEGQ